MSRVRYPHRATKRLEDLEDLNGPKLHDQIYSDILIPGLDFTPDLVEDYQAAIELLGTLIDIYQAYSDEAGPFGDMWGEYLECNGETSERNGQFFTPIDVVDMMVEMAFTGQDLGGRPKTICDPACGTGRFMLRTARYFAEKNHGAFNFLFTNIDIDRRAVVYCTMNAVLNGIPAICIHGDTLRLEVWDAFATLPIGQFARWERLRPEVARNLIIQSLKPPAEPAKPAPPAPKPLPKETVQAYLFPEDGEAA